MIDTFAAKNASKPGYTFDVKGNPYFYDGNPRRIDYIFALNGGPNPGNPKEQPVGVVASRVVLNGTVRGFYVGPLRGVEPD